MNPFLNAIQQGYSPEDVLKFIAKAMPKFSQPIRQASGMGYNAKQIVGFLSKSMAPRNLRGKSESEIHEMNRNEDAQRVNSGLTMAATAVAAPLAASAARNALSRALPSGLANLTAGMNPIGGPSNTPAQPQSPSPSPTPLGPTSPTQPTTPQPQTVQSGLSSVSQQPPSLGNVTSVTQPPVKPQLDFNALKQTHKGFFGKIDELKDAGNDTDKISAYFRHFAPSQSTKFEKETGMKLEEIVENYLKNSPKSPIEEKKSPEMKIGDTFTDRHDKEATITQLDDKTFEFQTDNRTRSGPLSSLEGEKGKPITKSETVATPHGIGEVKEIRNGKAIVEIDGKKHQVDEDELESSPMPEKELDELFEDLVKGIEGKTGADFSRMVQWAGYNPENNTLTFLPHTGKLYKYGNISPEDAALLTDILSTRKTSGENFIGAWKAGSKSPIGAALSKLIRKIQSERGGKGNEYEETHEPIYSAYEPAIQAKKKKKKK